MVIIVVKKKIKLNAYVFFITKDITVYKATYPLKPFNDSIGLGNSIINRAG